MDALRKAVERRWYSDSPGILQLLAPLEKLFIVLARKRRLRLQKNSGSHNKPVIVVGNINVGGTGKTPTLIALVRELQARNCSPAVISRGYGRTSEKLIRVHSDSLPTEVGDEPLEIFRACSVPLIVSNDRSKAIALFDQDSSIDIILSDDGLQHYQMLRDIEISVISDRIGFGNGHCLPLGPLREPISRLAGCDFALILRSSRFKQTSKLKDLIPVGPHIAEADVSLKQWVNVQSGACMPLAEMREHAKGFSDVDAVCAIGQPEKFYESLRSLSLNFREHSFADHHKYQQSDFMAFSESLCLVTAKDAVKCRDFVNVDCWYLEIECVLPQDFIALLDRQIKNHIQRLSSLG
ncbi:MAG: tetraacyldisaccharide 4'-kinase [Flavobacteriales bacterium]